MKTRKLKQSFPQIITSLPEADINFDGVKGWIFQGENNQLVFFEIEPSAKVAEHSHDAQWGIVVEGEMELTVEGEARMYRKGDEYYIPAQAKHFAKFLMKSRIIDFFKDKTRFQTKSVP